MNNEKMTIVQKSNGKYYLLTAQGFILHSENTLEKMREFVKAEFANSYSRGLIEEA